MAEGAKKPTVAGLRWGAIAKALEIAPEPAVTDLIPSVVVQNQKSNQEKTNEPASAEKQTPTALNANLKKPTNLWKSSVTPSEFMKPAFSSKLKALKFITKLSVSAKTKKLTTLDSDCQPESMRHFLFDDTALRRGGQINELFQVEEVPENDFNEIVDQDDTRIEVFVSVELVGKLLESIYFKLFIFALIVMNSLLIGLQTSEELSIKYRFLFSVFDHCVLAIFVCEILLKWYHGFWVFWQVGWNILDFFIIISLLLGPQLSFLSSSRILRILRVLRAFRTLRSIGALTGLSMVVQTILQSIPDMANICLLLTIILLMLAVAGYTLFGRSIPEKFGDLETSLFSLFICVTQDGWVNIYNLFKHSGSNALYFGGTVYFMVAIILGAFVFANLIVAVVVTNLELAMKEIREEENANVNSMLVSETEGDDHEQEHIKPATIIPFSEVQKGVDFSFQTPLQLTDMRGLTLDKLEKYFLIITALEDNLAEYMNIKRDLQKMYELVRKVNTVDPENAYDLVINDPRKSGADADEPSGFQIRDLRKGDIMSGLMKLQESMGNMGENETLGDFLKTTKDYLQRASDRQRVKRNTITPKSNLPDDKERTDS